MCCCVRVCVFVVIVVVVCVRVQKCQWFIVIVIGSPTDDVASGHNSNWKCIGWCILVLLLYCSLTFKVCVCACVW